MEISFPGIGERERPPSPGSRAFSETRFAAFPDRGRVRDSGTGPVPRLFPRHSGASAEPLSSLCLSSFPVPFTPWNNSFSSASIPVPSIRWEQFPLPPSQFIPFEGDNSLCLCLHPYFLHRMETIPSPFLRPPSDGNNSLSFSSIHPRALHPMGTLWLHMEALPVHPRRLPSQNPGCPCAAIPGNSPPVGLRGWSRVRTPRRERGASRNLFLRTENSQALPSQRRRLAQVPRAGMEMSAAIWGRRG